MSKRPCEYVCVFKLELFGSIKVMAMGDQDARRFFYELDEEKLLDHIQTSRPHLLGAFKRNPKCDNVYLKRRTIQ